MATEARVHPEHAGPEDGVLGWLDGPRLVVGAFAFFLLGLCVLGILLYTDQRKQVLRIDQIVKERRAEQVAANTQTVERCFANAALSPALDKVLRAIESTTTTKDGRRAVHDFRVRNAANTNTLRECRQLAEKLDVPIPKGAQ